jgi:hypothetical protein
MIGREGRVAECLRPIDRDDAEQQQHGHRAEDRPALALVPDHAAEDVGQSGGDADQQQRLHQVRQRGRIFVRMRRVCVEETAAVGAEDLYHLLRGDRSLRDRLLHAFQRSRIDIGREVLRHPFEDKDEARHDGDRQQDVEADAGDVDPAIADALGLAPRKAANQRQRDRDADRRRDEIVHRQPRHLHEVARRQPQSSRSTVRPEPGCFPNGVPSGWRAYGICRRSSARPNSCPLSMRQRGAGVEAFKPWPIRTKGQRRSPRVSPFLLS